MAITLDLSAEEEQELQNRAERAGQDVTAYLLKNIGMRTVQPPPLSDKEFERLLDELAESIPADVPPLSDYEASREGMYEERFAQILEDDYARRTH